MRGCGPAPTTVGAVLNVIVFATRSVPRSAIVPPPGVSTAPAGRAKIWISGDVTEMSSAERSVTRTVLPEMARLPATLSLSPSPIVTGRCS
jgi:hypothetical protein